MTQFGQPDPAKGDSPTVPVRLRLVDAVSPSSVVADRPYPQHSLATSRALRALDVMFDGLEAVGSVARVLRQTFGRAAVIDHKPERWAESAARHPSAQAAPPTLRVLASPTDS